jgi:hypothetical protein
MCDALNFFVSLALLISITLGGTCTAVFAAEHLTYVTNYGIKCDGSTDNTAAFAAMESRAGADEILATPPNETCVGEYVITRAHRTLFLSPGSRIKCPSSIDCDAITVNAGYVTLNGTGTVDGSRADAATSIGIKINGNLGASHVAIQNITVAHTKNNGAVRGYGIQALDVPYFSVENIYVTDTGGIGVFANINGNADIPGLELQGIRCDRTAEGGSAVAGCISVHNHAVHGVGGHFYINATITKNSARCPTAQPGNYVCLDAWGMKNSVYADNVTSGSQLGHSVVDSDNVSIANNSASAFTRYGLEFSHVTHSSINGTRCDGGDNGDDRQHCVLLDGSTSYVTVNDTQAKNIRSDIIQATPSGGSTSLTDIAINETAGTPVRGASCIHLHSVRNFSISGGNCDGTHSGDNYGVRLVDSFPGSISHFSGRNLDRGIQIAGTNGEVVDGISIGPNSFENVATPISGYYVGGASCGEHIKIDASMSANGRAISSADFCRGNTAAR